MSNMYYFEHSLDNIESWLRGYYLCCNTIADNYDIEELRQMSILYDEKICSIVRHCKKLLDDIKEGESIEK